MLGLVRFVTLDSLNCSGSCRYCRQLLAKRRSLEAGVESQLPTTSQVLHFRRRTLTSAAGPYSAHGSLSCNRLPRSTVLTKEIYNKSFHNFVLTRLARMGYFLSCFSRVSGRALGIKDKSLGLMSFISTNPSTWPVPLASVIAGVAASPLLRARYPATHLKKESPAPE